MKRTECGRCICGFVVLNTRKQVQFKTHTQTGTTYLKIAINRKMLMIGLQRGRTVRVLIYLVLFIWLFICTSPIVVTAISPVPSVSDPAVTSGPGGGALNEFHFQIIHTSDLHSMFTGTGPDRYPLGSRGHFARIAHLIKRLRAVFGSSNTLTLDSGDWFGGSLFHLISMSYLYKNANLDWLRLPIELAFLDDMRYDATTIGNHEFDGGDLPGYAELLHSARRSGIRVPIVVSNVDHDSWGNDTAKRSCSSLKSLLIDESHNHHRLQRVTPARAFDDSGSEETAIVPYLLKELIDERTGRRLKVGIMGLFGIDASLVSITARHCINFVGFNTRSTTSDWGALVRVAYDTATMLREKEKVDIVISLSHLGEPDDDILIGKLQEHHKSNSTDHLSPVIDIHLSAHTHSHYTYAHPIHGTIITQNGAYGINLSFLQLSYDFQTRRVVLRNANAPIHPHFCIDCLGHDSIIQPRIPIDSHIPFDEKYFDLIVHKYVPLINDGFLSQLFYKYDTVVGTIDTQWKNKKQLVKWIVSQLEHEVQREMDERVAMYMTATSGIRLSPITLQNANSTEVTLQFSDVFKIFATGAVKTNTNPVNLPADPVIGVYTKKTRIPTLIMASAIYEWFRPITSLSFSDSLRFAILWDMQSIQV